MLQRASSEEVSEQCGNCSYFEIEELTQQLSEKRTKQGRALKAMLNALEVGKNISKCRCKQLGKGFVFSKEKIRKREKGSNLTSFQGGQEAQQRQNDSLFQPHQRVRSDPFRSAIKSQNQELFGAVGIHVFWYT